MGPGDLLLPLSGGRTRGSWTRRGGPARLRIATGLAIAAAGALLVAVVWTAGPDPDVDRGAPDVVRVGVVEGQSVPGYLSSSRGELAALMRASAAPGETWALVSLSAYVSPDKLPSMLGGAAVAQVYARAPLGAARTQVVRIPAYRLPDDVVAGMLNAAVSRDRERADYTLLSRELTGTDPNDMRLRRAYDDAATVAGAEATAYREHCSCVFAAVVRGAPAALDQIAERTEVRVVDPAPEVRALDRTEFRPPLPEQHTIVPVETRSATPPAPGGGSPVASETLAPLPSSLGSTVTTAAPDHPVAGSGPSAPASEEHPAVPSAPAPGLISGMPFVPAGASRGVPGR
jgi:hypothetical protein